MKSKYSLCTSASKLHVLIRRIPVVPSPDQFQILQYGRFHIEREGKALTGAKRNGLQVHSPAVQVAVQVYRRKGKLFKVKIIPGGNIQLPSLGNF